MSTSSPAGWYPQPDGTQRWWTGTNWAPSSTVGPNPAGAGELVRAPANLPVPQLVQGTYPPPANHPVPMVEGTYGYQPAVRVAPKSPAVAALASFFLPGLGQFVNGQVGKGVLFLLAYTISFVLLFVVIGFFTMPVVWIWSMVDAHSGARAWNARHGILS